MLQNKLFQNRIEDTSFYYEQRKSLLNKQGFYWKDIDKVEQRLNQCINSFFPERSRSALDFCLSIKDSCDFGELYGVVAIIIRSKAFDELKQIIENPVYFDDKDKTKVIIDAIRFEDTPNEWIKSFIDGKHTNSNYIPVILEICGYKGIALNRDNLVFRKNKAIYH